MTDAPQPAIPSAQQNCGNCAYSRTLVVQVPVSGPTSGVFKSDNVFACCYGPPANTILPWPKVNPMWWCRGWSGKT